MQRDRGAGKKLKQVARVWAGGQLYIPDPDDDDREADTSERDEALAAFGLVLEQEPERPHVAPDRFCYLWPCNLPTFLAWQKLQTQWRFDAEGRRRGLDYAGVSHYLRDAMALEGDPLARMYSGVQAMEFESLNVWSENAT